MGEWYTVDLFKKIYKTETKPNQKVSIKGIFNELSTVYVVYSYKKCVPKSLYWDGNIKVIKNKSDYLFQVDENTIDVENSLIQVLFIGGDD